jgi:Ca2+ transporting ATPase
VASSSQVVASLCQVCALCNDSRIAFDANTAQYSNIGEPTEAALKVLAEKAQTPDNAFNSTLSSLRPSDRINAVADYLEGATPRILTFEFSRDRKSMSVLVKNRDQSTASLLVKGAPDSILARCTHVLSEDGRTSEMSAAFKTELAGKVLEYGKAGLRTLALARRDGLNPDAAQYHTTDSASYVQFEQGLTFLGLVGMRDPPRPEVRGAIAKCASAGIRIVVITGDERNTAETVCRQIGIFGESEPLEGKSYTGRELDEMAEGEKLRAVMRASLFSRTEPRHKKQIVDLLQEQGLVVAMVRCLPVKWSSL